MSDPAQFRRAVPTLMRIGLVDALELRLGGSLFDYQNGTDGSTAGAGPISIGGKYRLVEWERESLWRPSTIGLEAQLQLPVGPPAFNGAIVQPSAVDASIGFALRY